MIIEVKRGLDNNCDDDKLVEGGTKNEMPTIINNSLKKVRQITRGRKINKSGKKTLRKNQILKNNLLFNL